MSAARAFAVAIALLLSAGAAVRGEAQSLGRLFTSVEQRAILDEIREQARFEQPELEAEPEPESEPVAGVADAPLDPLVSKLTVNGIVRRSGGRTSVWVNGAEVERGGRTREGVAVDAARQSTDVVRLRLPSGTQSIALRPGQEIDVRSGLVLEPYEQGSGSANAPSAFATPTEAATPESTAGAARPDAPAAAPQAAPGGAAAGLSSGLPTGTQQAAADDAMVPDIVKQLRAIGKLPPRQQAEALARLSAANAAQAASAQPQRQ